jgi:cobalt-zinc-cadmium efflux system protein
MAHTHTHSHHHSHAHNLSVGRKLAFATIANVLVVVAELAVGFASGSLALIGDALHNLTDAVALLLALIAVRLERRLPTVAKTYGYQRAGILVAFINSGVLVAFTAFLFKEALERFREPSPIQTSSMLVMAAVALIVNTLTALSLRRDSKDDVNIRSAVLHMVSDAAASAGIIVAALLIRATGILQWDAVISLAIGLLILWSSYGVLKESMNLLLEGTPAGIDPDQVAQSLRAIGGVRGVHHVHVWAIGPSSPALSAHLQVGDVPVKSTASLLDEVHAMLASEYRIAHSTIQFEFEDCAADDPYCVPVQR